MRRIEESHDPSDREAALRLALKGDDEIPIGILYRGGRKSFESQQLVLQKDTLVAQCD